MSRPLKQRDIACARCFRLKRKCDHVKPSCGECRRKNAECLPTRSHRAGDNITVPLAYLKELERRVAELEATSPVTGGSTHTELRDVGVQTESVVDVDLVSIPHWIPWDTPRNMSLNWKKSTDEESALIPLETQPEIMISRTPSISPPLTGEFAQFNDVTVEFIRIDRPNPIYPLIGADPQWLIELYASIYFSISNREWPFLNEPAWQKWQREEIGPEEWRIFFLRMVYAIGASLCSAIQQDPAHSVRSREMYASAMNYYPHVVAQQSMVLQVQASLLLIVYALHSPSSDEITTSVSSIVPFCTAAMTEIRKRAIPNGNGDVTTSSGEILTENMFIACFMLNVIITSGWDQPVSEAYRAVEEDMCILGDTIQTPVTINPALGHLFRLRKIQANIKRSRWQLSNGKDASNSSLKSALDIWRNDIPRYGTYDVSSSFQHPNWMVKLYDYSILILMEEKRNFLDHEDTEEIFSAVVEVCLNFRRLQGEGHVMCFTWSAFVYQFRAGITLLYLIWATSPLTDKFSSLQNDTYQSPEAIEACTKSLTCFVDRWKDATPYLKVFRFLKEKTLCSVNTTLLEFSSLTLAESESCLELLKRKYLHRAILGMIEDMMYAPGEFVRYYAVSDGFDPDIAIHDVTI
ncbi:hypothetical protein N7495_002235 [Penicillium taxi]|uniref:uncharacterized protein n=1 Tax=Penicillium taxi TaxID=168475 RepID=UPI002545720D|nr:uncharacterized protein N7495_002235 [Penicillium taxi]KAJ5901707.1 hypothetical protein N7495_002235 [Penicillium taxi]